MIVDKISRSDSNPNALKRINKGTTISKPKILTVILNTWYFSFSDKSLLIGSNLIISLFNAIAFVLED